MPSSVAFSRNHSKRLLFLSNEMAILVLRPVAVEQTLHLITVTRHRFLWSSITDVSSMMPFPLVKCNCSPFLHPQHIHHMFRGIFIELNFRFTGNYIRNIKQWQVHNSLFGAK